MTKVEIVEEGKLIKVDGILYIKSHRKTKTEEDKLKLRAKRRIYMRKRRLRIKAELLELKTLKTNKRAESASLPLVVVTT